MNGKNKIPQTIKIPVYDKGGILVEERDIPAASLGGRIYRDVLRQAVVTYEANRRSGTAKTKTRAEVSYSGKKPWPQKGTGNARAGSRSSPIWVGGGVAHGPKVRDYSRKLNRKMRKRALASALLGKAVDGEIKLIGSIETESGKTRDVASVLTKMGVLRTFMIVTPAHDGQLWKCTRNIRGASMKTAGELNAYEVLRSRDLVFFEEAFGIVLENLSELSAGGVETVEVG